MYNFKQKVIPNSSIKLEVELVSNNKAIEIDEFIKTYKISNFFKGKFFIKRIIKKVFKYQLEKKIKWKNDFWNSISITLVSTKLNMRHENFYKELKTKTTKKRFKDILKYQKLIGNSDLGNPLYITGNALNIIGANVKKDDVYILDGSRRIIAYFLNNINPDIILIDLKENN